MSEESDVCGYLLELVFAVSRTCVVECEMAAMWLVLSCGGSFAQDLAASRPVARQLLMVKLKFGCPLVAVAPVTNGSDLWCWCWVIFRSGCV